MTKTELLALKEFIGVTRRDGKRSLLVGNNLIGTTGYLDLSRYNENLLRPTDRSFDIVEVFQVNPARGIHECLESKLQVIWKRSTKLLRNADSPSAPLKRSHMVQLLEDGYEVYTSSFSDLKGLKEDDPFFSNKVKAINFENVLQEWVEVQDSGRTIYVLVEE